MSKECCLLLEILERVTRKKEICLRTAASLIMARFDNPLSLMLNAEGVQITGDGTIVKGIFH